MKLQVTLTRTAFAAAVALTAVSAYASPTYPVFTFKPPVGEAGSLTSFPANDIAGRYSETFTATTASDFSISLLFQPAQFVLVDSNGNTTYNSGQTGLGFNYGLYALFQASGTFVNTANGPQFTVNPGGSFSFYIDYSNDTTFTQPATGVSPYTTGNAGDDVLLATGAALNGVGIPGSGPNLAGSFGQTTTFNLTAAGSAIFTAPVPFYNLSLQSGQFTQGPVTVGQTTRLNGTLDAIFASNVPEPTGIALVGVALLAAGVASRKSRQSKHSS